MDLDEIAIEGGVLRGYRIGVGYHGLTILDLHTGAWAELGRSLPPSTKHHRKWEMMSWSAQGVARCCWRIPELVDELYASDEPRVVTVRDIVAAMTEAREERDEPPFPMPGVGVVAELLTPAMKHWRYFDYLGGFDEDVSGILSLASALATSPTGTLWERELDAQLTQRGWEGSALRAAKRLALAKTDGNVARNRAGKWGMAPRWGDPPRDDQGDTWTLAEEPEFLNRIDHIKRRRTPRPS